MVVGCNTKPNKENWACRRFVACMAASGRTTRFPADGFGCQSARDRLHGGHDGPYNSLAIFWGLAFFVGIVGQPHSPLQFSSRQTGGTLNRRRIFWRRRQPKAIKIPDDSIMFESVSNQHESTRAFVTRSQICPTPFQD